MFREISGYRLFHEIIRETRRKVTIAIAAFLAPPPPSLPRSSRNLQIMFGILVMRRDNNTRADAR